MPPEIDSTLARLEAIASRLERVAERPPAMPAPVIDYVLGVMHFTSVRSGLMKLDRALLNEACARLVNLSMSVLDVHRWLNSQPGVRFHYNATYRFAKSFRRAYAELQADRERIAPTGSAAGVEAAIEALKRSGYKNQLLTTPTPMLAMAFQMMGTDRVAGYGRGRRWLSDQLRRTVHPVSFQALMDRIRYRLKGPAKPRAEVA